MSDGCPMCGRAPLSGDAASPSSCESCSATFSGSALLSIVLPPLESGAVPPGARIPLSPGFRSRFDVRRVLGSGGMGMVCHAFDNATQRDVAIKFLHLVDDPAMLARFLREGRAMARLRHANVVPVYDLLEVDGHPCLVTAYLEGGTLRDRLVERGRLPPGEAVSIAQDCLAGLQACHEAGLVHRDIKPENVLFDAAGRAHIADLGVIRDALDSRSLTVSGGLVGTPAYMPPEQVTGGEVTAASDVYAMGLVLHEMLAGRPPFEARALDELLRAQVGQPPPPLERSGVAPELAGAVRHALAKIPASRPRSAADFADELVKAQGGRAAIRPAPAEATVKLPVMARGRAPGHAPVRAPAYGRAPWVGALLLLAAMGLAAASRPRPPAAARVPDPAPVASASVPAPAHSTATPPVIAGSEVQEACDAAADFTQSVNDAVRSNSRAIEDQSQIYGKLERRGSKAATLLATARRSLESGSAGALPGAVAAYDAMLAVRSWDVEVAKEQLDRARTPPVRGAVGATVSLFGAFEVRSRTHHVSRAASVLGRVFASLEATAAPDLHASLAHVTGLRALRLTGWVVRRIAWSDEHAAELRRRFEERRDSLARHALPGPLGSALAEAADALWSHSTRTAERADRGAARCVAALQRLRPLASAPLRQAVDSEVELVRSKK